MSTAVADLQAEFDRWHAEREETLRAPHGWLSLTALHWLTPDPVALDGLPGRWSATADGVVLTAAGPDGLYVRGGPEPRLVDGTVVLHPVDGLPGSLVEVGDRVVEVARRTDHHVVRVRDPQAPTRTGFTGVPTYPVDARRVLDARFEPYPEPRRITVDAVVDGLQHFPTARGVGEPDADGRLTVDLNRLVNLPCAFTDFATCPLPPDGNVLDVAVEAGERTPG